MQGLKAAMMKLVCIIITCEHFLTPDALHICFSIPLACNVALCPLYTQTAQSVLIIDTTLFFILFFFFFPLAQQKALGTSFVFMLYLG